jgi:hypothetical protein
VQKNASIAAIRLPEVRQMTAKWRQARSEWAAPRKSAD